MSFIKLTPKRSLPDTKTLVPRNLAGNVVMITKGHAFGVVNVEKQQKANEIQ
jgi:hypothetical protein